MHLLHSDAWSIVSMLMNFLAVLGLELKGEVVQGV